MEANGTFSNARTIYLGCFTFCENYSSYLKDLYTGLKSGTSDKRKWEELREEFGEDWARDWFQKQNRAKPCFS